MLKEATPTVGGRCAVGSFVSIFEGCILIKIRSICAFKLSHLGGAMKHACVRLLAK